jgi:hypothetical protein
MRLGLSRRTGDKTWIELAEGHGEGQPLEIGRGRPVGRQPSHARPEGPESAVDLADPPAWRQGLEEFEPLRGAEQLCRHYSLRVGQDPLGLPRGGHPHGHEVLLVGIRRNRADARRHGDRARLGHQRGGRDLYHHEPARKPWVLGEEGRQPLRQVGIDQALDPPLRDGLKRRERHGEQVKRLGHGLAMEVAA